MSVTEYRSQSQCHLVQDHDQKPRQAWLPERNWVHLHLHKLTNIIETSLVTINSCCMNSAARLVECQKVNARMLLQ